MNIKAPNKCNFVEHYSSSSEKFYNSTEIPSCNVLYSQRMLLYLAFRGLVLSEYFKAFSINIPRLCKEWDITLNTINKATLPTSKRYYSRSWRSKDDNNNNIETTKKKGKKNEILLFEMNISWERNHLTFCHSQWSQIKVQSSDEQAVSVTKMEKKPLKVWH